MYRKCKYTNEKVQKQLGRCFILLHSVIQCKLFRGNCVLVEFLDVRSVTATTVKSQQSTPADIHDDDKEDDVDDVDDIEDGHDDDVDVDVDDVDDADACYV